MTQIHRQDLTLELSDISKLILDVLEDYSIHIKEEELYWAEDIAEKEDNQYWITKLKNIIKLNDKITNEILTGKIKITFENPITKHQK